MKTNPTGNSTPKIDKHSEEIQPTLYGQRLKEILINEESKRDLNAKILKITMEIKNKYPELSKYLEEMRETIPDEKNPDITIANLRKYFDSLNWMLNKYILKHSSSTGTNN